MKRTLGVCYYPEQWDDSLWPEDAARMVDAGLSWVRIGEFAWSRLEPTPGEMRFGWLDRAIETLGAAGLKVVLGTPTAAPPRWMIERYPDMLALDAHGRARNFGSRRHYCFSHPGYLEECRRIVTLLAKRYGANPHVAAWQTDNEYGCHETTLSFSAAARTAFQDWLAQRYQSPDALNRAWGNVFWSMDYADFAEIGLPNLTVTEPNPAHIMDFRRFSSDQVGRFNRAQVAILRAHSSAPIAHNFTGRSTDFDHFDLGADLDIAAWDSYPLGFLSDRLWATKAHKRAFLRQGDPDFQAFHHDLYRAVGQGRWWIMELQPGPVNWAPFNPAPREGMERLWAWEAFAHGAEAVIWFRWRQAPFAQEQMHAGLLRPNNTPTLALAEVTQVARELRQEQDAGTASAQVALVFDYASQWAWEIQPQGQDFDYFHLVLDMYRGLRGLGLNIDIIPPDTDDLSAYKLVLVPGLFTLAAVLRDALGRFAGTAIIGPRSNSKTCDFAIPVPLPPNLPNLDAHVTMVESLPPDAPVPLAEGGAFEHWAERLEGLARVVENRCDGRTGMVATGGLHYIAGWPDRQALRRILTRAAQRESLMVLDLPDNLRLRTTKDERFVFNYGTETAMFDGHEIPAAGVLRLALTGTHSQPG